MSLQFDPKTQKITYRGQVVGEHQYQDGRSVVRLNIEYVCDGDDWLLPLSCFSNGLSALPENRQAPALLTVETSEDCIAEEFQVLRFLTEREVKRGGYVWRFHKTDSDGWPSPLHGHDYEKGLKVDAINGAIYDASTRAHCKTLKARDLDMLQASLRASKDFNDEVARLIDSAHRL